MKETEPEPPATDDSDLPWHLRLTPLQVGLLYGGSPALVIGSLALLMSWGEGPGSVAAILKILPLLALFGGVWGGALALLYRRGQQSGSLARAWRAHRDQRRRTQVAVSRPTAGQRCPFCHDAVPAQTGVACADCLARHHAPCWEEHARCSACGGEARYGAVEGPPRERA